MGNELVTANGTEFRQSTDAAGLCSEIVKNSAATIQGKKYVTVEGWQAIAIAHGCTASADDVQRVNDEGASGFKCTGIVRRMSDGAEISRAEGFIGDDEPMWAKRPVYARRAMVQTRAISRACRSAFAHVVVMMKAGLSTTPAEEVPHGGFDDAQIIEHAPREQPFVTGPAKNKTQLKAMAREMGSEIMSCGDADQLDTYLKTKDAKALLEQLKTNLPSWWEGEGDNKGIAGLIQQQRDGFANEELAGHPVTAG